MMMKKTCVLACVALLFACKSAPEKNCESVILPATTAFEPVTDQGFVPFYVQEARNCLAVNSVQYLDSLAQAKYTGEIEENKYEVYIHTLLEIDGESSYHLVINGEKVASVQNIETEVDYAEHTLLFGEFEIKKGDEIRISFQAHTNGKIPEDETTAWARGRWTSLELKPVCKKSYLQALSIEQFPGGVSPR